MKPTLLPALLCTALLAASAAAKDITVDPNGDVKTVQAAFDQVPNKPRETTRILIKPGKYEQQLTLVKNKNLVTLVGLGAKPDDTVLSFHLKASDPKPDGSGTVGTTGSASTTLSGNDFSAENITFENSAGNGVGQAVALKTLGDKISFKNCRFLGYQDTLYPHNGNRVYFQNCYIRGNVDFIFGSATAFFDHCTIESVGQGYVTAASTPADVAVGFVFADCTLTASPDTKPASVYLGRPWGWDKGSRSSVTFLRTKMGPHIRPEGWHPWDVAKNTKPEETTRYAEFGSLDLEGKPLDVSKRVPWSKQLTQEEADKFTAKAVLGGSDNWDPTATPAGAPTTSPAVKEP